MYKTCFCVDKIKLGILRNSATSNQIYILKVFRKSKQLNDEKIRDKHKKPFYKMSQKVIKCFFVFLYLLFLIDFNIILFLFEKKKMLSTFFLFKVNITLLKFGVVDNM